MQAVISVAAPYQKALSESAFSVTAKSHSSPQLLPNLREFK
ncbi:hypothetical protein [Streptomyces sp. NPDC005125]